MNLIPKKWADFQHYKDRCPPWIKLHSDLLNDRAFMRLPLASKALAPLLWLLASESKNGVFDASVDELEFRLRLSRSDIETGLKSLIDNGFFLDASTMLASRLQDAIPETEGEREAETETEQIKDTSLSSAKLPDCPHDSLIDLYSSRLPELPQPRKSLWKNGKNAKALASRWRWVMTGVYESGERKGTRMAETEAEGLAWFDRYFSYVSQSDFLTGKASEWTADLGWLVNRANFEKVIQGNYQNKKGAE